MAIVELADVRKIYPLGKTEVHAVRGVSFEIEKGDFISLAGPSGSGKTTILNLIGCIDVPSAGTVRINGRATERMSDAEITFLRHEALGFIFQSFNLIPVLNVYENIEFPLLLGRSGTGRKEREEWIDFLIDEVGLDAWRDHRRTSCPADSASALPLPGRWSPGPRSYWRMSPRPTSTPRPVKGSLRS